MVLVKGLVGLGMGVGVAGDGVWKRVWLRQRQEWVCLKVAVYTRGVALMVFHYMLMLCRDWTFKNGWREITENTC